MDGQVKSVTISSGGGGGGRTITSDVNFTADNFNSLSIGDEFFSDLVGIAAKTSLSDVFAVKISSNSASAIGYIRVGANYYNLVSIHVHNSKVYADYNSGNGISSETIPSISDDGATNIMTTIRYT